MKPLVIAVLATEGYHEYIPFYVYFISQAYPEYDIIIYYDGKIHNKVLECLDMIKETSSFKLKPIPYQYNKNKPQALKSLRWVLYDPEFENYENVYIGDIDMLIVKEIPSLNELHIQHAEEIGLPYSNIIRPDTRKLTGLHFIRTQQYFPRVLPTMEKYRKLIEEDKLDVSNENLLYQMMKESVGLPSIRGNFITHHGIHMRCFNGYNGLIYQRDRTDYPFEMLFEKHYINFGKVAFQLPSSKVCLAFIQKMRDMYYGYSNDTLFKYANAGVGISRQFDTIWRLAHDLEREKDGK